MGIRDSATYEVLKSQLDRYPEELQNDMAFLAEYSIFNKNVDFAGRIVYDDKGVEVFNFGKYKGMSVSEEMCIRDRILSVRLSQCPM